MQDKKRKFDKKIKHYQCLHEFSIRLTVKFPDKIKDLVTDCLTQVAEKGVNAVYTKENFKSLYQKYCG